MNGEMNSIIKLQTEKSNALVSKTKNSAKCVQMDSNDSTLFQRLMTIAMSKTTANKQGGPALDDQVSETIMTDNHVLFQLHLGGGDLGLSGSETDVKDENFNPEYLTGMEYLMQRSMNTTNSVEMKSFMADGNGNAADIQSLAVVATNEGFYSEGPGIPEYSSTQPQPTTQSDAVLVEGNLKGISSTSPLPPEENQVQNAPERMAKTVESKTAEKGLIETSEMESTVTDFVRGLPMNPVNQASEQQQPIQPPAGKAEPYSQIGKEILSTLEQKGPMEFKLQLEPEDLGKVDIKLRVIEGRLMIDIMAASAKTQGILSSQVDRLIQSIGLTNAQVESVQVTHHTNQQGQNDQSQAYFMNGSMDFSQRRKNQFQEQATARLGVPDALEPQGIEARSIYPTNHRRMDYVV